MIVIYTNYSLIIKDKDQVLFIISISSGSRFFIRGNSIWHDSETHVLCELYTFPSNEEAKQCLNALYDSGYKVYEFSPRAEPKTANSWTPLITILMFFISVMVLLLTSIIVYGFFIKHNDINIEQQYNKNMKKSEITIKKDEKSISMSTVPQEVSPAEKRVQSLLKAANNGLYTVTLSSGHARTIFVFSDPLCPHCRELEPVLEALTRDYNIEIFPVTVIGHRDSLDTILPVICASPDKRALLWVALMRQNINTQIPDSCEMAKKAIDINNQAFNYYEFSGTPTLLTDDGHEIPLSALTSDDALATFMDKK